MNLIYDYYVTGFIGNCNPAYSEPITAAAWNIAKATFNTEFDTHNAAARAFFEAAFAMRFSYDGDVDIPPNCFTTGGIATIEDAYYGPTGWWVKSFEFRQISMLFWNSLQQDPYKLYGTSTNFINKPLPDGTNVSVSWDTNYDLYPTVTKELYNEYRAALEDQMHALKVLFKLIDNDAFPTFVIPA
jgi:hypothetical protein